ncbi:hypothetical protein XENTR_v10003375 [Xenopus tropicalis]|nr:hypothetical protein XENTR_v10003375 [Xenopus tropicalis]
MGGAGVQGRGGAEPNHHFLRMSPSAECGSPPLAGGHGGGKGYGVMGRRQVGGGQKWADQWGTNLHVAPRWCPDSLPLGLDAGSWPLIGSSHLDE